jgi:hypothetical protein
VTFDMYNLVLLGYRALLLPREDYCEMEPRDSGLFF